MSRFRKPQYKNPCQGIDRDVYQILRKLEDEALAKGDGKGEGDVDDEVEATVPRFTVTEVLHAIKHSNSALARIRRAPLEASIERVVVLRKREITEVDSDEEAFQALEREQAEREKKAAATAAGTASSLLNRQLAKGWKFAAKASDDNRAEPSSEKDKKSRDKSEKEQEEKPEKEVEEEAEWRGKKRRLSGTIDNADSASNNHPVPGDSVNAASEAVAAPAPPKKSKTKKIIETEEIDSLPVLGGIEPIVAYLEGRVWPDMQGGASSLRPRNRGLLLSGPLGCGKKSIIRYLAAKWKVPLLIPDTVSLLNVDKAERVFVDLVDEARRMAPCIVLFPRLHKIITVSSSSTTASQNEQIMEALFHKYLAQLQEASTCAQPIAVCATTTSPESIPPELLLLGRFQKRFQMKVPDLEQRRQILEALTTVGQFAVRGTSLDLAEIARRTHSYVAADLKILMDEADLLHAHRQAVAREKKRKEVSEEDDDDEDTPMEGAPTAAAASSSDPAKAQDAADDDDDLLYLTTGDVLTALDRHTPELRRQGFSSMPKVTFDQVGGLRAARDELYANIIRPIQEPDLYVQFGFEKPSGVLLWGPPGCGKTLVAQAVANAAQASFILIKGPELLDKYVGESERKIRELFTRARACAPCLLFFDEMDSLVPRRASASTESGARIVNTFLTELDGGQDRKGVFVIATTNRPEMIDPAMLRPGRLNRQLFIDLPNEDERADILATIFRNRMSARGYTPADLALVSATARDARCANFSGADLDQLYANAVHSCLRRYRPGAPASVMFTADDWEAALQQTKATVTASDHVDYLAMAKRMR